MSAFDLAMELIRKKIDQCDFLGEIEEELVEKAENFLGIQFPADYRKFVLNYGTGCIGNYEIYGITKKKLTESSAPDTVWSTNFFRENTGLVKKMIIIESIGDGDYIVLNCEDGIDKNFLMRYAPGSDFPYCDIIHSSFGEYLLQLAKKLI